MNAAMDSAPANIAMAVAIAPCALESLPHPASLTSAPHGNASPQREQAGLRRRDMPGAVKPGVRCHKI